MSKTQSTDKQQVDKMDAGGHLGGTHFGQTGGDAKTKDPRQGDKARPNDGKR